jgi:putative aminopeptidase FrvX
MNKKKFLNDYMNAYSPVSKEAEGQAIWASYLKEYVDELHDDSYGNVWGVIKSDNKNEFKVVIEAHCDEISWLVSHIGIDGRIHVNKNGGSDIQIAPSKRIVIHTRKNGHVQGVFGWTAVHLRKSKTSSHELKDLFIDIGLDTGDKVRHAGIEVGDIVTFNDRFEEMGEYYVGKALDNKIGGYIIAEVARKLKKDNIKLPYDLYIVNCVQEEVGLHGSKMVSQSIKPDIALVTDVCHNTNTPGVDKYIDCDIKGGKGGVFAFTAQNHRKLTELMIEVSEKNKIPHQMSVGSFGNDTIGFFLGNGGTPTSIISTPLKYMHTTVEMAHKDDVEHVINIFYHTLLAIENGMSFKYHNF